jgi:hypothetical protein
VKISLVILLTFVTFSSAHAADLGYYQNTAESIFNSLQTKASQLDVNEKAALDVLNSGPNKPDISPEHEAAQELLANSFSGVFPQADDIDYPGYVSGTPFDGSRDVYTFCPAGSEVKRPLTTTISLETQSLEYAWGWSHCEDANSSIVAEAIRIQAIWVSNVDKPILTLQMVEDSQLGHKTNLEIDLNKLLSGKISESQILAAITHK